jgi:molybdenum cofactor cytidylyltransferase
MRLIDALRWERSPIIAFVGAGGKTTALFRTANEIKNARFGKGDLKTVLVTTTTHLGSWQIYLADHFFIATTLQELEKLGDDLPNGIVVITGEEKNNLMGGISGEMLDELRRISEHQNLPLLIEADGAHACPLKAPAKHEPVIPDFTQQVVVVAGMSGLGKPLNSEWVHRPELFAELSGLKIGEKITESALVNVLLDKNGGLRSIPSAARKSVLLNQADNANLQSKSRRISEQLIPRYDASLIGSLIVKEDAQTPANVEAREDEIQAAIEPIGGIILAAGGSSRFGKPKQLLLWKGMPLIRHVCLTALSAGLVPVVVVIGSAETEVRQSIQDLPLRIVNNNDWKQGMSTSIKAGLEEMPHNIGGALFMQCDQPQIPSTLIRSLIAAHESSLHRIIAPQIDGQRGNPVLFDADTFPELLCLNGDIGGRALFTRYPVHWVAWHDPNILIDIDTPEDLAKFLDIYRQDEVQA